MEFNNTSNRTNIEPWYIPMDILRIICTAATIGISLVLLAIIVSHRTCRTVPMMLVANTCLSELLCACTALSFVVFTFENDLKQIIHEDSLCVFRAYLNYVVTVIQNHSYTLQAIYRYVTVVYPSRLYWQTYRVQILLIIISWTFSFLAFLPLLLTNQIIYNAENHICQSPIRLSVSIIYIALVIYMIPNMIINLVYMKLIRYVRQMNQRIVSVNIILRAERELKMMKNIVTIATILVISGLPYAIFILMSFFTTIPKYHFRVAFIFVDVSTTAVTIALFKTTDPIKAAVLHEITALTVNRIGATNS